MMLAWAAVVGPVGALALIGMVAAINTGITSYIAAMAALCVAVLLTPIVLTLVWAFAAVTEIARERSEAEIKPLRRAEVQT